MHFLNYDHISPKFFLRLYFFKGFSIKPFNTAKKCFPDLTDHITFFHALLYLFILWFIVQVFKNCYPNSLPKSILQCSLKSDCTQFIYIHVQKLQDVWMMKSAGIKTDNNNTLLPCYTANCTAHSAHTDKKEETQCSTRLSWFLSP